MSNTVALLRTVKSNWRIVHSVQTVSVANGPYSEHIRSVHLIMTSEHSVLPSVRSVRIVTVRMLRAVDGSYAPNKSSELLTVRILSTYGACIYGPYDPGTNRNGPYAWLTRTVLIPRYISYISHKAKQTHSNSNIPRSISHKPQNLKSLSSVWLKLVKGINNPEGDFHNLIPFGGRSHTSNL